MAAKEMYDYLSSASADYTSTTLSIKSQEVLNEAPAFNQRAYYADDGSEEVITRSTNLIFHVDLQWPRKNESDCGTVYDFFCDTSKAKGRARSFKWEHPTDGHTYVVKFASNIERQIQLGNIFGVVNCRLKVLGYVA